ncbi:MAG: amidase [Frankiales bacterium]|nr:amidase [Frankiales bacterium]
MTDGWSLRLPGTGEGPRVAVKDLFDLAGIPTTAGSAALQRVPTTTAPILEGLNVVGRTQMHELAYGITGVNAWQGTPTNPLDARLVPGGSSSGAAVVVAHGEADVALGTDTGGSVRIPAACCGVLGLKTTHGRVPVEGTWPLAPSFDTIGPLARDLEGLVTGMRLLEPGFSPGTAGSIARFRPPAAAGVDAALDRVLGTRPEVALAGWDAADAACAVLLNVEGFRSSGHLLSTGLVGEDVARRLTAGALRTAEELARALAVQVLWRKEIDAVLDLYDVIALPVLRDAPATLDDPVRMYDLRLTLPVNLAGLPALALPVSRRDGPPASLQLVGRSEEVLLATALSLA